MFLAWKIYQVGHVVILIQSDSDSYSCSMPYTFLRIDYRNHVFCGGRCTNARNTNTIPIGLDFVEE